jgi:hypothetical protein
MEFMIKQALFLLIQLIIAYKQVYSLCDCPLIPLEEEYCDSSFSLKINVETKKYILNNIVYVVEILDVFKWSDYLNSKQQELQLFTPKDLNDCGNDLGIGETYIITGDIDPEGENAWISSCNFIRRDVDLNFKERLFFTRGYKKISCEIRGQPIKGSIKNPNDPIKGGLGPNPDKPPLKKPKTTKPSSENPNVITNGRLTATMSITNTWQTTNVKTARITTTMTSETAKYPNTTKAPVTTMFENISSEISRVTERIWKTSRIPASTKMFSTSTPSNSETLSTSTNPSTSKTSITTGTRRIDENLSTTTTESPEYSPVPCED